MEPQVSPKPGPGGSLRQRGAPPRTPGMAGTGQRLDVSSSLNSLKGGYIRDYIGDNSRGY